MKAADHSHIWELRVFRQLWKQLIIPQGGQFHFFQPQEKAICQHMEPTRRRCFLHNIFCHENDHTVTQTTQCMNVPPPIFLISLFVRPNNRFEHVLLRWVFSGHAFAGLYPALAPQGCEKRFSHPHGYFRCLNATPGVTTYITSHYSLFE